MGCVGTTLRTAVLLFKQKQVTSTTQTLPDPPTRPPGLSPPHTTPQHTVHTPTLYRDPEMYQLSGGAPFRRDSSGAVYDSVGERIRLLGDTMKIIQTITMDPEWVDTQIAYVSRSVRGVSQRTEGGPCHVRWLYCVSVAEGLGLLCADTWEAANRSDTSGHVTAAGTHTHTLWCRILTQLCTCCSA